MVPWDQPTQSISPNVQDTKQDIQANCITVIVFPIRMRRQHSSCTHYEIYTAPAPFPTPALTPLHSAENVLVVSILFTTLIQ